jgi:hypothetical protein
MSSWTMNCPHEYEEERSEWGAALLIAIFALLLISVVGMAQNTLAITFFTSCGEEKSAAARCRA